jgi:dephospho-CoA kinase
MGVQVCDADELARAAMRVGGPVFASVVETFGPGILTQEGTLDRHRLGDRVFSCRSERLKLNALVHPEVKRLWLEWLCGCEARGDGVAALQVPLLYEIEADRGWDAVVVVYAPESVQVRRLVAKGFDAVAAGQRVGAQMPVGEKMRRADYVVVNQGTRESASEQTQRILKRIMETSHGYK